MEELIQAPVISNSPIIDPLQPQKNNYKILFFLFLGLFLIILIILVLILTKTNKPATSQPQPQNQITETIIIPSPTSIPTPTQITLTPTNDPTKDWKTYTNSSYGFSFKYPQETALSETNNETKISADEKNKTYMFYFIELGTNNAFVVSVWRNVSNYTLDQANKYLAHNFADVRPDNELTGYSNKTNYTLAGIKGIRGNDGCCGTIADNVLVIKSTYIYVISYRKSETDTTSADQTNAFNNILSSFRFH